MDYRIITAFAALIANPAFADNGNNGNQNGFGFGIETFSSGDTFATLSFDGPAEGDAIVQGFSSAGQTAQLTFDGVELSAKTFGDDASGVRGAVTGDAFGEAEALANREGFAFAEFDNAFPNF